MTKFVAFKVNLRSFDTNMMGTDICYRSALLDNVVNSECPYSALTPFQIVPVPA